MEDLIKELIEVVRQSNQTSVFEHLIMWIPILFSLIAIIISICVAHKQNKIALFEKRFKVIHVIGFLLELAKNILLDEGDGKGLLKGGKEFYSSKNIIHSNDSNNEYDVLNFYYDMNFEATKVNFLYPKEKSKKVNAFLEAFLEYASKVLRGGNITNEDKKLLKEKTELIKNENSMSKLEKYLKL